MLFFVEVSLFSNLTGPDQAPALPPTLHPMGVLFLYLCMNEH
jgi:hypothetical protein